MNGLIKNIASIDFLKNLRIQSLIGIVIILFTIKLFLPTDSALILFLSDALVIAATILIIYSVSDFHSAVKSNLLSLVINVGILSFVMFLLITFSDSILKLIYRNLGEKIKNPDLLYLIITFFYVSIFIISLSYIFLSFKQFYFAKQRSDKRIYFDTLSVFFLLALATAFLGDIKNLSFINKTFFIVSVFLIVKTSLKISWIAFISKKEKVLLLGLTLIILTLLALNIANGGENTTHYKVVNAFSPAVNVFHELVVIYGLVYFSILFFTTLFHLPTAEAFDRKSKEISSLQYFSRLITQVLDFNELLETIADMAVKVCYADAGWIVLVEGDKRKILAAKNIANADAEILTSHILSQPTSLIQKNENMIYEIENERNLPILSENISSLAVSILKMHEEVKGYLFAARKTNLPFDDDDKNALGTLADYASVAVDNANLLKESIEIERLEKELDVAREIQKKILPSKNPEYDGLEISTAFIPAFEVGGDYYDLFELGNNKLAFIIADVSGKGITAAFVMAEIKGIFESLAKTSLLPQEILTNANQILKRTLNKKNFVSAAYGILDLNENVLTVARAGHCPILVVRDNSAINLKSSGLALGLNFTSYFDQTLEEIKFNLKSQDVLVLYTDGITEAKNASLEDFGEENFKNILIKNCKLSADEIINEIIKSVTLFSQNTTQYDDITLVIFKRK